MAWWSNPYLPWNWGHDIKTSFLDKLENYLLYLLQIILQKILDIEGEIIHLGDQLAYGLINDIATATTSLGIFAGPIFILLLTAVFGGIIILVGLVKDTPAGDFI